MPGDAALSLTVPEADSRSHDLPPDTVTPIKRSGGASHPLRGSDARITAPHSTGKPPRHNSSRHTPEVSRHLSAVLAPLGSNAQDDDDEGDDDYDDEDGFAEVRVFTLPGLGRSFEGRGERDVDSADSPVKAHDTTQDYDTREAGRRRDRRPHMTAGSPGPKSQPSLSPSLNLSGMSP